MKLETIKTKRLYVQVAEQISRLVSDGNIAIGEKLPAERDLAEKLGVSRPTVREAMIALEIQGVVEIRTGSGIYILEPKPQLSVNDAGVGPFEILDTRLIIETEACALAASHISAKQIKQLKHLVTEMQLEETQADASERADMKFHLVIAEASQNSAISTIVKWLWDLRNQSHLSQVFMAKVREEGIHPSINEHIQIISALESGDGQRAKEAMAAHIIKASQAAAQYFNAN
ncbi:FadR/GntR family transcriptional regulator [Alteromonadaceae bacterium BrNp21-10]|nr:FadR/GntR family transcriptional regulator [Alteromonadaceae bacterium BrNp21-10]